LVSHILIKWQVFIVWIFLIGLGWKPRMEPGENHTHCWALEIQDIQEAPCAIFKAANTCTVFK